MTYRVFYLHKYQNLIWFANAMIREIGKEKTIEVLRQEATNRNLYVVRQAFRDTEDRSLKIYTEPNHNPDNWEGRVRFEIVEDTDTTFEMRVSECVFAEVFRSYNAADIGHAYICWGDYAHIEGFNPEIRLVRDKTLMQGHDCCNHRYIWGG